MNVPLFIPMAVTLVVAAIGFLGNRGNTYWWRGMAAIAVAIAMAVLGAGGGTLEDPSGDGLITRWIRSATDNGAGRHLGDRHVVDRLRRDHLFHRLGGP